MAPIEPRMPEVDALPTIEAIFERVRQEAARELPQPGGGTRRQVVIVTPGRLLMPIPTALAGSIPAQHVELMEKLISSSVKRQVAVIGYTELPALQPNPGQAIPFLGLLLGLAYIGHSVWVFEGHPSALAAGCRDADVLIADGAMVPFLAPDWVATARGVMRRGVVYVHDRATFTLNRVPAEP